MSLDSLLDFLSCRQPTTCRQPHRRRFFEQLEDRRVLATITLGGGGGQAGELDTSFSGDGWQTSHVAAEQAYDVVVDGSGRTVVVGDTTGVGGTDFIVARYNPDGSPDGSFGTGGITIIDFGGDDFGRGVALDGLKIVVAGYSAGAQADAAIARLNADGTLDMSFNLTGKQVWDLAVGGPNSFDLVEDVAVDGGSIVVVGNTTDPNTFEINWHVSRFTSAGVPDATFELDGVRAIDFGAVAFESAAGVAIQADGKIVVAGTKDDEEFVALRLLSGGADDSTFSGDGRNSVAVLGEARDMALQTDGSVVVVGTVHHLGLNKIALVRFLADGSVDTSGGFAALGVAMLEKPGANLVGADVAIDAAGKIVVAATAQPSETFAVARFNSNGTPDSTFGASGLAEADLLGGPERAEAIALDPDGKIVVAGWHTGDSNDLAVARFLPNGTGTPLDLTGFEGDAKSISGTFSDPDFVNAHAIVIDWGDGTSTTLAGADIGAGTFSTTHVFADDSILVTAKIVETANPNVVIVSTTAVASIENKDPTATTEGPVAGVQTIGLAFNGVRGQPLEFQGIVADLGSLDTHSLTWDFSDLAGTADQTGTTATRTYAVSGNYSFQLTVVDDDGGSVEVNATVSILDFQLQAASCGCGTALVIGGTDGADSIAVNAVTGGLAVFLNGNHLVTEGPSHGVIVYGSGGDDEVQVQGLVTQTAWLYGGDGNDRLKGGGGSDVILGQQGDDLLVGGSGRDLLIGGIGADRIVGNSDDDILISGTTDHDDNTLALCGILAEWTSSRCDYLRVANIYGCGTGPRHNGTYFLNDNTVHDDGVRDLLTGSSGFDWFFANLSLYGDDSLTKDKITDLNCWEFAKDIDFIEA